MAGGAPAGSASGETCPWPSPRSIPRVGQPANATTHAGQRMDRTTRGPCSPEVPRATPRAAAHEPVPARERDRVRRAAGAFRSRHARRDGPRDGACVRWSACLGACLWANAPPPRLSSAAPRVPLARPRSAAARRTHARRGGVAVTCTHQPALTWATLARPRARARDGRLSSRSALSRCAHPRCPPACAGGAFLPGSRRSTRERPPLRLRRGHARGAWSARGRPEPVTLRGLAGPCPRPGGRGPRPPRARGRCRRSGRYPSDRARRS